MATDAITIDTTVRRPTTLAHVGSPNNHRDVTIPATIITLTVMAIAAATNTTNLVIAGIDRRETRNMVTEHNDILQTVATDTGKAKDVTTTTRGVMVSDAINGAITTIVNKWHR